MALLLTAKGARPGPMYLAIIPSLTKNAGAYYSERKIARLVFPFSIMSFAPQRA
jgi:hypothetical protein